MNAAAITTATVARPSLRPTLREVFELRAWARATLWQVGEFDLHEAVDALQAAAVATGLITEFGQDEVQQVTARAFAEVGQ
jgi:hypothetical protein